MTRKSLILQDFSGIPPGLWLRREGGRPEAFEARSPNNRSFPG